MRPLVVGEQNATIDCAVRCGEGSFEVSSHYQDEPVPFVHCRGATAEQSGVSWTTTTPAGRARCCIPTDVDVIYSRFICSGFECGPSYRVIARAWDTGGRQHEAVGQLRRFEPPPGMATHPAALESMLQLTALSLSLIHIS